jgi:hypothetical protein
MRRESHPSRENAMTHTTSKRSHSRSSHSRRSSSRPAQSCPAQSRRSSAAGGDPRASRRSRSRAAAPRGPEIARLHSLFFQTGDLAQRYDMTFKRVIAHRRHNHLLLRCVTNVDDLIHAVACAANNGLAWSDLQQRHERTLMRRCRDGRDETETTVIVRRFIAELRRACLDPRCNPLLAYAGTRPLRNWLADELNHTLRQRRRAAFMIDPADSTCGNPFQFTPSSGTGW